MFFYKKGDVDKMNNVTIHELPFPLIEEIKRQENISKIFYLSKGSSEPLYIISYMEDKKEIFKLVCYGERNITDVLKEILSISVEEMTYYQKNSLQKLNLLTKTMLEEYNLDSALIDNMKISKENVDNYFKIYI